MAKDWQGCVRASNRLADLVCAMYHPKDEKARATWPTATWAEIIAEELGVTVDSDAKPKRAILEAINSKRDRYGNCYWALRYTDATTGKQVVGTVSGGESNISACVREMGLDWESCYYYRTELGIREFDRTTKEWPHAGCAPKDELVPFIRKGLETDVTAA